MLHYLFLPQGIEACEAPLSDVGSFQTEGGQMESAVDFERDLHKKNNSENEVSKTKTSLSKCTISVSFCVSAYHLK